MAVLELVFWETITPAMRRLLQIVGASNLTGHFYLAGGTALALRMGHRRSVDLDFFSAQDEVLMPTRNEVINTLAVCEPQVVENVDGNLLLLVQGLYVGFFGYGYRLLAPTDTVENVPLAGLEDLGLMKLDALVTRGSRKDFYDLYFIGQRISFPELLERSQEKYPQFRDFPLMVLESITLFDVADDDAQPDLLVEAPWSLVKQFFLDLARRLGREWFGY